MSALATIPPVRRSQCARQEQDHLPARRPNGTTTTQVDASTQAVTRRKTTLFGSPRGPQPSGWVGNKGFVGGTSDADTGLTHLGAREYDPSIGRFISVDPLIDVTDPLQMDGYSYSHNNPITRSDPTGLYRPDSGATALRIKVPVKGGA